MFTADTSMSLSSLYLINWQGRLAHNLEPNHLKTLPIFLEKHRGARSSLIPSLLRSTRNASSPFLYIRQAIPSGNLSTCLSCFFCFFRHPRPKKIPVLEPSQGLFIWRRKPISTSCFRQPAARHCRQKVKTLDREGRHLLPGIGPYSVPPLEPPLFQEVKLVPWRI